MNTASNAGRVRFVGIVRSCRNAQRPAHLLPVLTFYQPLVKPRYA
jgi:hypothetical protein